MKIKAGYGYWDLTHFGIGGSFRRAPRDGNGIEVAIVETFKRQQGCNATGITSEGIKVAFDIAHTDAAEVNS